MIGTNRSLLNRNRKWEETVYVVYLFAGLLALMGAVLLLWVGLHPAVLTWLIGEDQGPRALLEGYRRWYGVILAAAALGGVLMIAVDIVILVRMGRLKALQQATGSWTGARRRGSLAGLLVLFLVGYGTLAGAMLVSEDIPGLRAMAQEDLEQLDRGALDSANLWLGANRQPAGLPGPLGEDSPTPLTRYRGIGDETGRQWEDFYVPDALGFDPAPEELYNQEQSIQWNEANAAQFQVRYTTNFHLVAEIQTFGGSWDSQ